MSGLCVAKASMAVQEMSAYPFSDRREEALTAKIASVLERNVEIKVVVPLLELLGWDLALEANWGFRISIVLADGTYTKREADVVIADQEISVSLTLRDRLWGEDTGPARACWIPGTC